MKNLIALMSLSLLVGFGCGSKTESEGTTQASAKTHKAPSKATKTTVKTSQPQEATQPAPPRAAEKPIGQQGREQVTLLNEDQKANVSFVVPKGWTVTQSGPAQAQLIPPKTIHKDYVRTHCRLTFGLRECVDLCTTEHTLAGLEGSWENWSKQWVEPATRTGKPAKDAVKTTWKTVTDEKKAGFRLVSGHLTYPEEVKKTVPYRDRVITRCTQMNLGDTVSLDSECRGALEYEKTLREGFELFCRSVTIKELQAPKKEGAAPATPPVGDTKPENDVPAAVPLEAK